MLQYFYTKRKFLDGQTQQDQVTSDRFQKLDLSIQRRDFVELQLFLK